jgi:NAD(P)-dependent dehydrogenase (short-subunit alcohol dehydrogenase family)
VQELNGKVAVVTGGASGIGLALAHQFVDAGMRVMIGDVEPEALDKAVAELRGSGGEVEGLITDVTDPAQVDALAAGVIARFDAVHVVCLNAGVGGGGVSWQMPLSTWEWVIGVNMWGVIHGVRSFVPLLVEQGEGHVVNTASVAGLVATPMMGPYNASKHAVVAISETLHHEFALMAPGVHVSVLCPGWVKTNIADSARNRPDHLRADDGTDVAGGDIVRGLLSNGMDPSDVAAKVLDAIRNDKFWVLTHDDEADVWVDAVNRRLRSLESRENPRFGPG